MNIQATSSLPGAGIDPTRRPKNPEEAAKQFEEVLVRQFVQVMTENMFKSSLAGDDQPGWIESQADTQRDMFTDILAGHLVKGGTFKISDLLLRQWQRNAAAGPANVGAGLGPPAEHGRDLPRVSPPPLAGQGGGHLRLGE